MGRRVQAVFACGPGASEWLMTLAGGALRPPSRRLWRRPPARSAAAGSRFCGCCAGDGRYPRDGSGTPSTEGPSFDFGSVLIGQSADHTFVFQADFGGSCGPGCIFPEAVAAAQVPAPYSIVTDGCANLFLRSGVCAPLLSASRRPRAAHIPPPSLSPPICCPRSSPSPVPATSSCSRGLGPPSSAIHRSHGRGERQQEARRQPIAAPAETRVPHPAPARTRRRLERRSGVGLPALPPTRAAVGLTSDAPVGADRPEGRVSRRDLPGLSHAARAGGDARREGARPPALEARAAAVATAEFARGMNRPVASLRRRAYEACLAVLAALDEAAGAASGRAGAAGLT
jgi:hypothetical protein